MVIFRDVDGIEEIRRAVEQVTGRLVKPEVHYDRTLQYLRPYRICYEGGEAAVSFLIRQKGEPEPRWIMRKRHFENVPLIETIVEESSAQCYGIEPDRSIRYEADENGDSEPTHELDDAFRMIYTDESSRSLFRDRIAPAVFRDQWCTAKVWWQMETERLRISYIPRENGFFIHDPVDLDTCLGFVEVRKIGKAWVRWLWTTNEYGMIDEDWKWLTMTNRDVELYESVSGSWPERNPVEGVIPYVMFGTPSDTHRLDTAVQQQRSLINDTSSYKIGRRSQAGPVPVTIRGEHGGVLNEEKVDPETGKTYTAISDGNGLELEHGASFTFAQPNYPTDQMGKALSDDQRAYLAWNRVSPLAIDANGIPEQTGALALKMFVPQMERQRNINVFSDQEKRLGEVVHAYAQVYVTDYPKDDQPVAIEIEFPETVLPMDKVAERTADAQDVAAGRMRLFRYLQKWDMKGESDDAINAEVERIRAEVDAGRMSIMSALSPSSRAGSDSGSPARQALDRLIPKPGGGAVGLGNGNGSRGGMATAVPSGSSGGSSGPPGPVGGAGGGGRGGSPVNP